jgi:hypothetical protein
MRPNLVRQIIFFIPQFVKALHFLFEDFPDFIRRGGISIETHFQYKPVGHNDNNNFLFRTTIQSDADIINLLPELGLFPAEADRYKLYEEKYRIHRECVNKVFHKLDGIYTIKWVVSAVLSSIPFIFLGKRIMDGNKQLLFVWLLIIFWAIMTYLFRRYFLRHFFKLVIFLIKFWLKKDYGRLRL